MSPVESIPHSDKPKLHAEQTPLDAMCFARANYLSRELAGCLAIDPMFVSPLLKKLKPEAVTDTNARWFIKAVRDNFLALQDADPDEQANIVVHIASENNLLSDYCQWVTIPCNLYKDAPAAVKELRDLETTLQTLTDLQSWIGEVEVKNEWH